ncbi:MAG: chorismate synthase [Flavobacteriales bacterium]
MAGDRFGHIYSLSTFGESHGPGIGGVIDGCPPGHAFDEEGIRGQLARRRPGQSKISSQRKEGDDVEFLSGIFEGKTSGTPIAFLIRNKDAKAKDYEHLRDIYRPSHADLSYEQKYGIRDHRGGGRSSARETASWVVAGTLATSILEEQGVRVRAYVSGVGELDLQKLYKGMDTEVLDENPIRCPDPEMAERMEERIRELRKEGDTVGGVVTCVVEGMPSGLGEPVFEKLDARLGQAMMSINAAKGVEFGSGFEGTRMKGSEHNDPIEGDEEELRVTGDRSGGVQGGISTGAPLIFRVAFKPVATLMQDQKTVDRNGEERVLKGKGRHDPCVVPRAVPVVESMTGMVLMDAMLIQKGREAMMGPYARSSPSKKSS